IGVKGGFSLAKFTQTSDLPLPFAWEGLPFFAGGISFENGVRHLGFEADFLYVRMGGRYEPAELEYRFDYVQIPVLVKLDPVLYGPVRPFFVAGGYGAYLIKAQGVMGVEEANLTGDHERLDFGIVGGAGLALKLSGVTLSVEGRYNLGAMNIIKGPAPGDSMKNSCWMALAGLSF
ncbi:MAG: PorT family protein, partial [Candidatus Aminicenantes bacterium]|nr:PorT family protein [Candidatus Aminicenantes bacterium]